MADELEIDLNKVDEGINNRNKVEERLVDLSSKVKTTSQERDELKKLNDEKDQKIALLEKEGQFNSSFADVAAKNPAAVEFKDKIKEKTLAGYTLEDATVAVLAKEGKFTPPAPVRESPAGGSAIVNASQNGAEKSIGEMTSAEKRAALVEAEKRGDLGLS